MKKAKYKGLIKHLRGEEALFRPHRTNRKWIMVQFDNLNLEPLCFNWHIFERKNFKIIRR